MNPPSDPSPTPPSSLSANEAVATQKAAATQLSTGAASSDPLDEAVLKLAVRAAFLQGFAERLAEDEEEERPVEFGWGAGLRW